MKKIHVSKKLYFLAVVVAVAAIIIIAKVVHAPTNQPADLADQQVSLRGSSICLPHRNHGTDEPQTMECALGVKTEDGKYYALKGDTVAISKLQHGKIVTIRGTLHTETDTKYQSEGVLTVLEIIE